MLMLISGLSGAGKSTALHALEDIGFFCTDNLPLDMLHDWAAKMDSGRHAAVCVDARSHANIDTLHQALARLKDSERPWQVLYLEASPEVLQRRFSTLRRRHPYAPEADLSQAIEQEREAMQPLRGIANLVLDSTALNPYELAEMVESFWRKRINARESELIFSVQSFSYQRGLPQDADMVVDVRFLPNPHYQPELAVQTGMDASVKTYLEKYDSVTQAKEQMLAWLEFIWPQLKKERKQYFMLAFGCSGGRHRSVYMAEAMAEAMREHHGTTAIVRHRELKADRGSG